MLIGCRVVRGPDWKFEDQDGGEGGVGTIVDLERFADGRPMPPKNVLVYWDNGTQANYRAGINDCYDLRVFDSSSAGVKFKAFTCDGCMQSGITGIRWHCAVCHDFDLCNICYMNDVHDKDHDFIRFHISNDRTNGTNVGKRSASNNSKIRSKGIFPGAKVKRGRDWELDNELGLMVGKVVGLTTYNGTPRSAVLVNWNNTLETPHRVGCEGKVDLCVVEAASGPWYYKNHLPMVSMANISRSASTGGKLLKIGDVVKIELDIETLKQMAEGHGGWAAGMEKAIGKLGKVDQIDDDGDVHVKFGFQKWVFHPEALCKVTDQLRAGDTVRVINNKEEVMKLQDGHGGWDDAMAYSIGKVGKVERIDDDGDAHVKFEHQLLSWVFNPEALCKVTDQLRAGDRVRVINDKEKAMRLQDGHGGWNNAMENTLGKTGKIIRAVGNGDMVVGIENRVWVFNPSALILESKEEERQPAGQENPSTVAATTKGLLLQAMLQELLSNATGSRGGAENLLIATTVGDLDTVKRIIGNNKALVNQKFSSNKTPLQVACHQGKADIVAYLLENGADKEIKDEEGYTALHHAAYGDKSGLCVVIMVSANANVNASDSDRTKVTPMHLAVQRGNEEPVAALVQSKYCDINRQDLLGDTPLHEAILRGHDSIFTKLLKAQNLDPTICNANGFNILHLACLKDNKNAAKLLIEKFPGLVDIIKEDGFAALHITAVNNHHGIARHLILSGHCSINIRNQDGMTALALSVTRSYVEAIELLIEHGVDVNAEDNEGDTPLHVAVMKHCIAYIGLDLESLGINRPSQGNSNNMQNIEKAIALFLVKNGADINYRNHQGKTPLDLCIDENLKELMKRQALMRRNVPQAGREMTSTPRRQPASSSVRVPSPNTAGALTAAPAFSSRSMPVSPISAAGPVKCSPQLPESKPVIKIPCRPERLDYLPSATPGAVPVIREGTETLPRPAVAANMAAPPLLVSPTTAEIAPGPDVPMALSNDTKESETRRDPNQDIASEIQMSDKKTKSTESQKSNVQVSNVQPKQDELCRYCIQEVAVVIFKPCDHKVVCESCSLRARKCLQCNTEISSKIAPGEAPYMSLKDLKKDYENKIKELREHCDEMERIALCQICMDNQSNTVFRPCGHRSCEVCAKRLRVCHTCKKKIEERIISYQ